MSEAPLPCPFCGGEAVKVDGFTVACAHGLCIGWTVRRASPHEWNTRALPAVQPDAREAALREAADVLEKRADSYADGIKWGGSKQYLATLKTCETEMRLTAKAVLALLDKPAKGGDA